MQVNLADILSKAAKIHFIGVGGSGMYPLVQILLAAGHSISGSDVNEGEILQSERDQGVQIAMGHSAKNVQGSHLVVYSAAIGQNNPERTEAQRLKIPCVERSQMLGYVAGLYKRPLCVAGTHGKTTCTGMATQILQMAGLRPAAVIGGKLPLINGYGKPGKGDAIVVEACEYHNTFLQLRPECAVLLNVDNDHLEFFGDMENLKAAFRKFCGLSTGAVIYNKDDANTCQVVEGLTVPKISFGLSKNCDFRAENLSQHRPSYWAFNLVEKGQFVAHIKLGAPGRHNVYNALAAACACLRLGASGQNCAIGLQAFLGTGRRFQVLGQKNGFTVADDYAHHPTELCAILNAAKQMAYTAVWAVFQPYTFSRTKLLADDFAKALSIADYVVMTEIMGGRESAEDYTVRSRDLAKKIPGSVWFNTQEEVAKHVLANAKKGQLVLCLGCGDIYKCAHMIIDA